MRNTCIAVSIALFSLMGALGCSQEPEADTEEQGRNAQGISCGPQMQTFPVLGAHNIGYDAASCGKACATSCPDSNANSDWGGSHHGIDVFASFRAPLVAVVSGTVVAASVASKSSGLRVRLRDDCGWEYYYGHLDQAVVSKGQRVQAGQLIGYMGHSGTASTHLHFNVSPDGQYKNDINPFNLLASTSPTACEAPAAAAPSAPAAPAPPAEAPSGCGILSPGHALLAGEALSSCDGRFSLSMQTDGNLVLYANGGGALWSSGTNTGSAAAMQDDGNFVVYSGDNALWSSATYGRGPAYLAVQDDGNVVVYASNGSGALWSSGTHGP